MANDKDKKTYYLIGGAAVLGLAAYLILGKKAPSTDVTPHGHSTTGGGAGQGGQIVSTVTGAIQQLLNAMKGGGGGTKPGQGGSAPSGSGGGGSSTGSSQSGQSTTGQQANIPINWSEDANGVIKSASGQVIGQRNPDGSIVYPDGSVSYPDGVVWDATHDYFYGPSGEVWTDSGTVIGQFDENGNITAVQGALFDGSGDFFGWDNGNGTYEEDGSGIIYDSTTNQEIGQAEGDGTYINEYGDIVNQYTGQVESYYQPDTEEEEQQQGGSEQQTGYIDTYEVCDPRSVAYDEELCYE